MRGLSGAVPCKRARNRLELAIPGPHWMPPIDPGNVAHYSLSDSQGRRRQARERVNQIVGAK
jgi:hypothetical protein